MTFREFITRAFSEKGEPSSSRILSFWLSLSSMALIWHICRHAIQLSAEQAAVFVNGLPYIIGSLTLFAVSPYGIAKAGQTFTGIFNRQRSTEEVKE